MFSSPKWEAYESKFVNKPAIRSKTDDYGIEGEKLELDCTVEAQLGANFKIKWALPSNNLSLQVRLPFKKLNYFKTKIILLISNCVKLRKDVLEL